MLDAVIDDLLGGLVGEALFGRLRSTPRAQLVARLCFGLLGTGLGLAGTIHALGGGIPAANAPMRASMIALFAFMTCFCLFNVALARPWRWPGLCFLVTLALMFVTRIAFGP